MSSSLLEIAIGMAFVYLSLAFMVTALVEVLSSLRKLREQLLRRGIEALLRAPGFNDIAAQLYAHPLIAPSRGTRKRDPSYIHSGAFVRALRDVLEGLDNSARIAARRLREELDVLPDETCSSEDVQRQIEEVAAEIRLEASGLVQRIKDSCAAAPDDAVADKGMLEAVLGALGQLAELHPGVGGVGLVEARLKEARGAAQGKGLKVGALKAMLWPVLQAIPYNGPSAARVKRDIETLARALGGGGRSGAETKQEAERFVERLAQRYVAAQIEQLPDDCELKTTLALLWNESGRDVARLGVGLEVWFDRSMKRVSGWYKQRTQLVSVLIAFGLAALMNLDSLLLFRSLSQDPGLRASLVAQAEALANSAPRESDAAPAAEGAAGAARLALAKRTVAGGSALTGTLTLAQPGPAREIPLRSSNAEVAAVPDKLAVAEGQGSVDFIIQTAEVQRPFSVVLVAENDGPKATLTVDVDPEQRIGAIRQQLSMLGMPIGWRRGSDAASAPNNDDFRNAPGWPTQSTLGAWARMWLETASFHFLGWLISALAASLGAPFWFDLLTKCISVRSPEAAPPPSTPAQPAAGAGPAPPA